jgi:hypothetical protein
MSAHQLHRSIGVTYKTAWFMFHRIRHAMADPDFQRPLTGVIEFDETYIGGKAKGKRGSGAANKTPVVTLVRRDGVSRSMRAANVTVKELQGAVHRHKLTERDGATPRRASRRSRSRSPRRRT